MKAADWFIAGLLLLLFFLTGCARFHTTQYDRRYNGDGTLETEIVTKASAWSWFSSKQLAQWKASQTEKQQGASVGLDQQGSTNSVATIIAVTDLLKAAGAVVP